jgi:hypothetical protein
MLTKNFIPYADYESWRYGRFHHLDDCFALGEEDLTRLIHQAHQTCAELKLICESQEFYPWDSRREPLQISRDMQDQLLDDRSRSFDDFACGDLVDQVTR